MTMPTLLDVVKRNGTDAVVGLIEEAGKATPEVLLGAARTIAGLNYKTRVRTGLPVVGFRQVNQGTAVSKSTTEQRLIECFLMNPQFEVDQAAADASEDGAAAYLAEEALGITQAAFQSLGVAFFYGADASFGKTDAFPGLLQGHDTTNMVVNAGGSTALTSAWFVRWGIQDVRWVLGQGGEARVTDPEKVRLTDGSGNPYTGYRQELYLRPGLQFGSLFSAVRIKKIGTDTGKGLTDDLIDAAMALFPAGRPPTACYMTRRSRKQWKNSRTATSPTGAPAPWPDTIEGPEGPIPVFSTDSISQAETAGL